VRNQIQDFRDKVYGILLIQDREVYIEAHKRENKATIDALIDQGNENLWDAESVAWAIQQGFTK